MKILSLLFAMVLSTSTDAAKLILQESKGVPITAFNITFRVGSADDPRGKEGLAFLTAQLMREGGVKAWEGNPARDRSALEEFLFPYAASVNVSIDKEQVSLRATSSADDANIIFNILAQIVLAPAFSADDLERLKAETLDALSKQMPREDQEELGKAALEQAMWGKAHPYGHAVEGTVAGIKSVTMEDIVAFHKSHFTGKRLTIGIGGVVAKDLAARAPKVFAALPEGSADRALIPDPTVPAEARLHLVKGPFEAIGVHLGAPIPVTRSHPDFAALYVASTGFGKHRSFVGRLMRVVREQRGLNYGCYSYVEAFPHGGQTLEEPLQTARSRQAFSVWGRPTPVENGCFLLRQVTREVTRLVNEGLTAEEFALAKGHLLGSLPLQAASIERKLGYAVDAHFYGLPENYFTTLQNQIKSLSRPKMNEAIRRHLNTKRMQLVAVTPDPEKLKAELLSAKCDIKYAEGSSKPKSVLAEDKKISTFPPGITPEKTTTLEAEAIYAE